jgi:hypothetical protein
MKWLWEGYQFNLNQHLTQPPGSAGILPADVLRGCLRGIPGSAPASQVCPRMTEVTPSPSERAAYPGASRARLVSYQNLREIPGLSGVEESNDVRHLSLAVVP